MRIGNEKVRYLCRYAVDQDGQMIDILVQKHKEEKPAKRFFRKMLKHQACTPNRTSTNKLLSYGVEKK